MDPTILHSYTRSSSLCYRDIYRPRIIVAIQYIQFAIVIFFQTEDASEIQLVDFSSVISNPPSCLISSPTILSSFLRGAGIILTAPQHADDGEIYEEQIVFQPANCQENLRILEALFTVLVKGNFCHLFMAILLAVTKHPQFF